MMTSGCFWMIRLARRTRQPGEEADKNTHETAYYLLSTVLTGDRFLEVARSHWGVENRLHWRLDVVMNEDQQRNRSDNGPNNLAMLRHMALNVMQRGRCVARSSAPAGMTATSRPSWLCSEARSAIALPDRPLPESHIVFRVTCRCSSHAIWP
jgi:DDE family transposase